MSRRPLPFNRHKQMRCQTSRWCRCFRRPSANFESSVNHVKRVNHVIVVIAMIVASEVIVLIVASATAAIKTIQIIKTTQTTIPIKIFASSAATCSTWRSWTLKR